MEGFTILEVLVTCLLIAVLTAAGAVSLRSLARGNDSVESCADRVEELLQHANARAIAAQSESRIRISLAQGALLPDWREEPLNLAPGCGIRSAAFGIGGKSVPELIFYPSGTASPGSILITNSRDDWCRLTQSLRGRRSVRCFS